MKNQNYKQTKIGDTLNNWEMYELKDIAKILSQKFNPLNSNEKKKCIELEHLSQETGQLVGFINSCEQLSIKNIFQKGQILYGKLRPYLKKFYKAEFDGVCSSEIWVLNGIKVKNDYLLYLVQTNKFNQIANVSSGSKMPRADWGYMSTIPFLIPPLKEQEKIAEILTTWDEAITKQEQLIKEKEQLKKGLMQNLLSGKVRFSGFSDKWEILHLSKICDVKKGQQLNKLDLIDDGVYPAINGGMNPSGYTNNYNTEANTVTISEGGNCGYVNYITTKFWSGGHCYTLLNLKANSYFVFQYLKLFENEIMKLKVGSGLQNIQKGSIDSFNINLPSVEEQQKIAEVLSLADSEINLLKNELEEIKLQKKALMQKLLTGQVRVKI